MGVTQQMTDDLVARIETLVAQYGGQSDDLAKLRSAYAFWHRCPGDGMAYVLVLEEVSKLESQPKPRPVPEAPKPTKPVLVF